MNTHSRRGSSILVVMIFTAILALLGGSMLVYMLSESRLNHRNTLRFQAKNVAEAALEYAASEISARLSRNLNFTTDELQDSPISTHTSRLVSLLPTDSAAYNTVAPGDVALWASDITDATKRYIDPANPGNDYDPLRGQHVNSQVVRFLARATAADGSGVTTTAHATQAIEIRDVALFSYAIFYNLTMEFHPSPTMVINGPVHANKNSYLTEGGGITFLNTFTTAGDFNIGTISSSRPSGRNIRFSTGIDDNGDGAIDTISVNSPTVNGETLGTYVDANIASRDPDYNFRDLASQLWKGMVQDSSHGIIEQTPPGMLDSTTAHDMIEPPSSSASANSSVEAQKYSNKAGLYVVVESNGTVTMFNDPGVATSYKSISQAARADWRADNPDKVVVAPAGMVNNGRRMRDFRENKIVNLVDIDLGVMKTAVGTTSANQPTNFKVNGGDWNLDHSSNGWNGIVYVDVESPTSGYTSTSDVSSPRTGGSAAFTGAGERTAVRLYNGKDLPNRRDANPSNSFLPEGLSVATNAPIYIAGHYNADGSLASDLSDTISPESGEVPAAIIADAINVLSDAWIDSSGVPVGDGTSANTSRPAAAHTEVSAAFLTGIVPTSSTGSSDYSGGVENYPRFHEDWSGKSLRYRGSITALFHSEIATGKWSQAKYSPPKREWGFNSMFGSQRRYPPGTPIIRTFRRLDYRDLSATEFSTYLSNTSMAFTQMTTATPP